MVSYLVIVTQCSSVAFIGGISNIKGLCTTYPWLGWLCKKSTFTNLLTRALPHLGCVPSLISTSDFLPPILLALLMLLLPILLRVLARFEGIPTRSGLELSLMNRYFGFQVIHSFLIVSFSLLFLLIKGVPDCA
jgi:hypothetical protein